VAGLLFLVFVGLAASGLIETLGASATSRDRTPPTAPTNLRITGRTSYSVSLAWSPSTDNSGKFSYRVRSSSGSEVTVPQTQTSLHWTANLEAGRTYSFYVYAVDAAGNKSKDSNTQSVTLPRDTVAPSAPVVSVTDVGPTHVSLQWSANDDGPYLFYSVFKDGSPVIQGTASRSATITALVPGTTYTFTVQARDNGVNWSAHSAPLAVTTEQSNPNDAAAPTTPANLQVTNAFSDGEMHLGWNHSVDDVDPNWAIRYDVYVNGALSDTAVNRNESIVYGVDGQNTITVVAVDSAGNRSAPATTTVVLDL
jgi:chitinase